MVHALSTYLFVNQRLTTAMLGRIWDAGIQGVEIFSARQHLDYHNKAQIAELGHWFRDSKLEFHALHSPVFSDDVWGHSGPEAMVDITEPVKAKRIKVVDEIKRALEIAETAPFRYLIQHFGMVDAEYDERRIDAAFNSLEEITIFARQRGVEVLLENTPNHFSSAERLLHFLAITHLDLNFCFDIGHAHMNEGVETAYQLMGPRIRSTHVHDNDSKDDTHLFPCVATGGTVDWMQAMKLFDSAPGQFPLLLELRDHPDMGPPLSKAQEVFERLEKLNK
jgi:sugar phosphate isomerase/epimerase